jgi:hypothetical protein
MHGTVERYEMYGPTPPVAEPHGGGLWVKHEDALTALQQHRKQVITEVEEALEDLRSDMVDGLNSGPVRAGVSLAIETVATLKGGTDAS